MQWRGCVRWGQIEETSRTVGERETERERYRDRVRETERQRERDRVRETERQRDRERER